MTLTHSGASELNQLMEGTTAGALIPEIARCQLRRRPLCINGLLPTMLDTW
jgi:hypothetical protein